MVSYGIDSNVYLAQVPSCQAMTVLWAHWSPMLEPNHTSPSTARKPTCPNPSSSESYPALDQKMTNPGMVRES